jgi:PleD family two-component response regulator
MRAKLRSDDLVGRFSEDRFVAVLRRLDLALGQMIARKLLTTVEGVLEEQPVLAELVRARCGLADLGPDGFEGALTRCFEALRQARTENHEGPVTVPSARHEAAPAAQRV